jgi:hypothetical protein
VLSGCGGGGSSASGTTTTTTVPDAPSVIRSPARQVSFPEVKQAIDRLYAAHPGIRSFTVRDVQYNPITRDKVLEVCRRGGAETDAASLESLRVAGCAPLIFFFYEYGRRSSVPESVDVATKLYWYAVRSIHGPFDPKQSLTVLLRSWGIP